MDKLIEFLNGFNVQTIVSMVAVMWYFTREIHYDLKEMNKELKVMNTRISRIEGTVYGDEIYKKID